MKADKVPIESILKLAGSDSESRLLCKYLLDVWADVKDVKTNNKLLKRLVLRYADMEKQMSILHEELKNRQRALLEDLAAAAGIQKTLLPSILPQSDKMEAAFEFLPCDQVGGDLINLVRYDGDHWLAWVVDVAGHGPRAAMITVSVAQFLQPSANLDFMHPASIMRALDKEFPFARFGSFFTIIFGVVNLKTQTFTYCNSGHPNPVLLQPGSAPTFVEGNGPMLGLGVPMPWPEVTVELTGGKSILLYTDGLVECANASGHLFGEEKLLEMLNRLQYQSVNCLSTSIMKEMRAFMGDVRFQDDLTFLALKARD